MGIIEINSRSIASQPPTHRRQIMLSPDSWGRNQDRLILACTELHDMVISSEDEVQTNLEAFPTIGMITTRGEVRLFLSTIVNAHICDNLDELLKDLELLLRANGIHINQETLKLAAQ